MKKIIEGKVYDTDTAKKVASYSSPGSGSDFNHFEEDLFLKKTGEFFLFGVGGPMTRYAKQVEQNNWSGGKKIIPLSYQAAKAWAEEHLTADEYEAIFGEIVEEDGKEYIKLYLPADLIAKLRREAQEAEIAVCALVEKKLS